ncbi:hypothetical protein [Azohydromonas sp.]|uniref:hypothetical protein n=1 Tax=Azohydromonas sp. TaxID=1872666 RepID=UPI002CE96681|nr:hypothetical protein [Azohydromonas sp.]HMM87061.1 hypothetical protein [Azohydromonas sp.]
MNRPHYRGGRPGRINGLRADAPTVARVTTDSGEVGVAVFHDGARALVVQSAAATNIVALTPEQARCIADALLGGEQ